jgi:1-acyl-sn-glycerol-3-phosphate acyltransferase
VTTSAPISRAGGGADASTPPVEERTLLWRTLQSVLRVGTTLMFDLKVYGKENVPATGGALLAANHESYLDPVLVGVRLRRPVSFMAKSELFEHRAFGWLIGNLHAFPVRQGKGDRGAINETIERLKEGHILNLFPEGTRSEDGELAPIQSGVALVVRRAGVPIVPVAIAGSFDAWPRTRKLPRPRPIHVMYGKPLEVSGLKGDAITKLIDRTLRGMIAELRARRAREAGDR